MLQMIPKYWPRKFLICAREASYCIGADGRTIGRFHPIAQKQKTDLNIASVLVRAGGPGPGRPLRQSQAGNLVATSIWPGLGWAGLGEGAASRGCWRAAAGQATTHPLPAPARPGPTLQPTPDITSFQCVHGTADCLPGPSVMQS